MKYLKAILCALLVAVMLTGCSFRMSSSIEELIGPVSPFGDNADIQDALGTFAKNGYSLKTPSGGRYMSSYSFFDIDGDGEDEALAFYEPSDNLGTISLAIIKKTEGKWNVAGNIKGDGKDIYSIDFADVNADKKPELLICWDAISNSSNHNFSVYRLSSKKNKLVAQQIGDSISINNYVVVDYNQNSTNEIILFELNNSNSSAKAELYSLNNNSFKLLGETKLDPRISKYTSIQTEKAEGDVRVYADAVSSDGSSMLTEIIYWSNAYDTIISPFYSYSTGITKGTSRNLSLESLDVNDDGLIEIPMSCNKIKKLPKSIKAVDWKIYKNTVLKHAEYSLVASDDGYILMLPNNMIDNISVSYDNNSRVMTILDKNTKTEQFSIIPVLKVAYNEADYSGYEVVLKASGYYYLAKTSNDSNIKINDLKNLVKAIN